MTTQEITKKIADLLYDEQYCNYNGNVYFDFSSYDDDSLIPYTYIDGEKELINHFWTNNDGTTISISLANGEHYDANLNELDEQTMEDMRLLDILRDVYYQTEQSWEIGDFELDFLL